MILMAAHVSAQYDTTAMVGSVPVGFRFPAGTPVGSILVLPGWNFSRYDVCQKSKFCVEGERQGYVMVFPEMLKSVYASKLYPETRTDWKKYPTLKWITDTLIPFCREAFHIFRDTDYNFLYGISTGARGVALVAENTGSLFLAGAALSGDYDQAKYPNDNLMKGYYGPYEKFPARWEGSDNPYLQSKKLKTILYLAHGKNDAVVPCSESVEFSKKIIRENPAAGHYLHVCDTCGHNYAFWNSQTTAVFNFYKKFKELHPKNRSTH